jgi:VWFA-related protein
MRYVLILCCALGTAGLAFRANAQPAGGGQGSEAAKLVRLNVVASDSQKGSELTADDFHITDDGKPQKVILLRGPGAKPAVTAGPGEFSNRPASAPHTTAILFDFLNTNDRAVRLEAAKKIGQSLKQLASPESVVLYLLALDGKLVPVHPFPTDPGAASNNSWVQEIDSELNKAVKANSGARPSGIVDEEFTKRTYLALETLANQLAAYPGRRDILWVTTRIQYTYPVKPCTSDWIDCGLYVPHLSVTLDRAGVAVNLLSYASSKDADTAGGAGEMTGLTGGRQRMGQDVSKGVQTVRSDATRDMGEMAALTGGKVWFGNDITNVIQSARGQDADLYTLAFEPPHDGWDNKFHRVKITADRKSVTIQAKTRYYALPDQRQAAQRDRETLVAAYNSPADMSELGLRAKATSAGNKAQVELHIDPADLLMSEQGGAFSDQVMLLLSPRTEKGPQGEPAMFPMELNLTREQREKVLKEGIPIAQEVPIDGATRKVRIILLDRGDNLVGSLTVPLSPAK